MSVPGLDGVLGLTHTIVSRDKVLAQFTIAEQHLQPFGIPHGGTYCAAHESTASVAGMVWLDGRGVVVGTSNTTDFIRQASVGETITVTATPVHRGRTQQLWRLESVDSQGRLVATGQVRLANLDRPVPPEVAAAYRVADAG